MEPELFSTDNRLRIIERYLLFLTLLVFSYLNLRFQDTTLGYYGLFFNIIIFFISFYFVIFDIMFLVVSVSRQFGHQLENFIIRTRSWITYPLVAFIILIAILFVRFYFGIDWEKILLPILTGCVVLLITQTPIISSWIKKRFEPKQ